MINVFYALASEELERFYAFREAESRVRKELSLDLINKIKTEAVSNVDGIPLYEAKEGIAHINISGMLESKRTVSSSLLGDVTTYAEIQEATVEADEDPFIREIYYHINSPGGKWDGIDYAAEVIKTAKKMTTAIVYTGAQSGGYYLASQADKVVARTKGSMFGSIGVATEIFDRSEEEGKKGVKRIVLTNSQSTDKRPDVKTDEGISVIQRELDDIYMIFENRVVEGRSKNIKTFSAENIRTLKGASVTAEKALELGLIDEILTEKKAPARGVDNNREGRMKLSEILEKDPEAKAEYDASIDLAKAEGLKAADETLVQETKRIEEILALGGVVMSDDIKKAISSKTDPGTFAKEKLLSENAKRTKSGNAADLGTIAGKQIPKEQAKDLDTGKKEEEKVDSDVDKYLAETGVKKGGK